MCQKFGVIAVLFLFVAGRAAGEHLWTDASGRYTTQAALVDFDGQTVVLKNVSGRLVSVPLERLSRNDQAFLTSQASFMAAPPAVNGNRVWSLRDGSRIVGQAADFGRSPLTIQRQYGRILVNGKYIEDLSPLAQQVARRVIEYFDRTEIDNYADLQRWASRQGRAIREFTFNGVQFETANGEKQAIPFFMLSKEDQQYLQPGWEQWVAEERLFQEQKQYNEAGRRQEELLAQARTRDYQRGFYENQMLQLNAIQAGILSEWVVQLYPSSGNPGMPMQVLVPARTSSAAKYEVAMRYPGYYPGPVAKVSERQWW
jgi:hypothetical protein